MSTPVNALAVKVDAVTRGELLQHSEIRRGRGRDPDARLHGGRPDHRAGGLGPAAPTQKSPSASRPAAPMVSDRTLAALMQAAPDVASGIAASDTWVLRGTRTATGRPILANDPHLGTQVPSVWYLAHVLGGTLDAIGATLPGLPGITIGHNQRIAWGVTNVMTDVQDVFVERVNTRQEALYRGLWEPMRVRRESIKVKGAP